MVLLGLVGDTQDHGLFATAAEDLYQHPLFLLADGFVVKADELLQVFDIGAVDCAEDVAGTELGFCPRQACPLCNKLPTCVYLPPGKAKHSVALGHHSGTCISYSSGLRRTCA